MATLLYCLVGVVLMGVALAQTNTGGNTGMTTCQQTFLTNFYKCIGDNGLDTNNFLSLVTNKTNGQPAADEAAFKTSACGKENDIGNCMITFMTELMNSTTCQAQGSTQDQRPMIDRQFVSLMRSFSEVCAHPCRRTFLPDLRACYSDNNIDPDLFLSNATMGRGAVIGTTDEEAHTYCDNKDALFACMRKISKECPESPMILGSIGLDIDSMDVGIGVLCAHTKIYLDGIECFAEATEQVQVCMQDQARDIMALMVKAEETEMPEEDFRTQFCGLRIKHVRCDLNGWREKKHKACNKAVIGLRTELECSLLTDNCRKAFPGKYEEVCHEESYERVAREGAAGHVTSSLSVTMFLVSLVAMATRLQ